MPRYSSDFQVSTVAFTSSGVFQAPPGVTTLFLTGCGGGAGGVDNTLGFAVGGGGGASISNYPIIVSAFQSVTITIGQGGAPGLSGAFGQNGGSTSFGQYVTIAGGNVGNAGFDGGGVGGIGGSVSLGIGEGGDGGTSGNTDGENGSTNSSFSLIDPSINSAFVGGGGGGAWEVGISTGTGRGGSVGTGSLFTGGVVTNASGSAGGGGGTVFGSGGSSGDGGSQLSVGYGGGGCAVGNNAFSGSTGLLIVQWQTTL